MKSASVPDPAFEPFCVRLLAGTRVATPLGWRTVERLRPDDRMLMPSGAARVLDLKRAKTDLALGFRVIRVPPDCLGNREEALLRPEYMIRVDDPAGLVIPLDRLQGHFGISEVVLRTQAILVRLILDHPAAICVAHGLWVTTGGEHPGNRTVEEAAGHILLAACAERVGRALRKAAPPTFRPGTR